jgi:phosphopantothenoylcysteine synthetase/decarboxylase
MGCGCKTGNNYEPNSEGSNNEEKRGFSNIILRLLAFMLMMVFLPIIMIAIIWFIFELVILNKEIDMKKIVRVMSSKIKPFNEDYEDDEDDDYDDDDEFTEENYEMVDVEDVTPIARK